MAALYQKSTATLLKHLQDNFSTLPVRFPNTDFDPETDGSGGWVWATVQYGDATQETIGGPNPDSGQLIEGRLFLQVFARADSGLAVSDPVCDELIDLFNTITLTSIGTSVDLRCAVPIKNFVGTSPEDVWFQQNVDVPFHYHLP